MKTAKAVLLSKTDSYICKPEDTRMIVVQPLIMRIFDKVCLKLIEKELLSHIGPY
jgi:hypothetical protein